MTSPVIARRHVFFLSGFDPKGASWYHALYRKEAQAQAQVTATRYEVGPRTRLANGNSVWEVRAEAGGHGTTTTFEYVRWDDIVRAHWPRSGWEVLAGSLRAYRAALASPAALRKVWRASPRTLVSLATPAGYWIAALLLALGLGTVLAAALAHALGGFAAALGGIASGIAVLWAALAYERRLNTSWLLRIYQFAADWRAGRTPEVPPRLDELAQDIRRKLQDPQVDEVLLVGFSVGSLLAASAASRVQRAAAAQGATLERLSVVTLGHCIPLLGLMKGAEAFRAELARLGQSPAVRWVDFSSITDWGSFALVDPLAICLGPAGPERPHAPRMASPRFHTLFTSETYARIVRDKRRMHLQYLMATERPGPYDYFAITAGPLSLPERLNSLPAP